MPFSKLILALGLIATALSTTADATTRSRRSGYFCGEPPADWSPPWEKRQSDDHDRLACHMMMREHRKKMKGA